MNLGTTTQSLKTTCCIVGGGPAGMLLGYLLARAGVEILVLEKHNDFLRDFRGDTIHPSTLQVMYELGLLEKLLKLPHQKVYSLRTFVEDQPITIADFSRLEVKCPYIAFMPQWDFLNFLSDEAQAYPNFKLLQNTTANNLIVENDRIIGVVAQTGETQIKILSNLVVAADGRSSTMRQCAELTVQDIGAPMDVFWFKIIRNEKDPSETFGKFSAGTIIIAINRKDYWQCGFVIAKGQAQQYMQHDVNYLQRKIANAMPFMAERVAQLTWDDVKLLTVKIDFLQQWYKPGLLCIGDAAHAMSPVGGVGINLAIQDAVAAANLLTEPLLSNTLTTTDLAKVQRRRTWPVKVIQRLQRIMQQRVIKATLQHDKPVQMPWLIKKILRFPFIQRIMGHIIGIGIRPEHVRSA